MSEPRTRLTFIDHTQASRAKTREKINRHIAFHRFAPNKQRQKPTLFKSQSPRRHLPQSFQPVDDEFNSILWTKSTETEYAVQQGSEWLNGFLYTQLSSPLDPFVWVAIPLSLHEQSLLHFFLSEGRQQIFCGSRHAEYCVKLRIMLGFLADGPFYTLAFLAMAESALCRLRGADRPASFFRRRARMYSAVRRLLDDPEAHLRDRFLAVSQLIFAEFSFGSFEIQTQHAVALDEMVRSKGGLAGFLRPSGADRVAIPPHHYVVTYCVSNVPIKDTGICDRFVSDLLRILAFSDKITRAAGRNHSDKQHDLSALRVAMHQSGRNEIFSQTVAQFSCCFNICITFLEYRWSTDQMMEFLTKFQRLLDLAEYSCVNHAVAVIYMLADIRAEMAGPSNEKLRDDQETRIAESTVQAIQVFTHLSESMQRRLRGVLVDAALAPIEDSVSGELVSFLERFEDFFGEIQSVKETAVWHSI